MNLEKIILMQSVKIKMSANQSDMSTREYCGLK